MKLERLISIIYKLLNNEVLSASALAEEYGVSQRTIYRDIDVICAAGIPVVSYQGTKGGYGIMDGYKMDRSLLGSYDVSSLITVLHSMSTVFEDERVLETIERLQTIEPGSQTQSLSMDIGSRWIDTGTLRILRQAIKRSRVIRYDYINAKNERSARLLEPARLMYKYGNWYVAGWCRSRREVREFRVSRMANVEETDETFAQRHVVEEGGGYARDDAGDTEPVEVVMKVAGSALARAMDQFSSAEKHFNKDGSLTLKLPVDRPHEAQWLWAVLLSFGDSMELVEPVELRDVVRSMLESTLRLYTEK
ncbi:helix-turn-helix transcriptional regulator [Paenibacillus chartarius]|uniref:Helix-turn-helix transcriptional regulator n=1 Tax=Paenibacillus chartarius TaxID=747481 RepID=A0ABV6DGF9_9BACL